MNELEQKLKSADLAAPSAELDRRIDAAFSVARRTGNGSRKPAFWWWLTAATAAGVFTALFIVSPRSSSPVPGRMVYRIEAQGCMREMLLNSTAIRREQPRFDLRVTTP